MEEEFNARKRMWHASHPEEARQILEEFIKRLKNELIQYMDDKAVDDIIDKFTGEKLI